MSNVYGMTDVELVKKLLRADREKVFVVMQIAPALRVMLGEQFGFARGEDSLGKITAALRLLGADVVVDCAIAQDIATLLQLRALKVKKENGGAPVVVGRCDGISPMDIGARMLKKHYAAQAAGKSVRVVTVACCEKAKAKVKGADVVLTMDELVEIIKEAPLNIRLMKKSALDTPFGVASGAAYICASAGGKSEAVARCLMTDKDRSAAQKLAYSGLYGGKAVREAVISAGGTDWSFAVVACPEEQKRISEEIDKGICGYDFVEFTHGGCISHGLGDSEEDQMKCKLRGLGLRYIDRARSARSADRSAYAEIALKEWESMVRTGEAVAENTPITEDELTPAFLFHDEIVEELAVDSEEMATEEVVEEPVEEVIEEVVEEPVEEVVEEVVEEPVEEVVEEVVEEPVEEVVEEVVEEPVEEVIEEVVEEPVEEVVEEVVEEPVVEKVKRQPYSKRLSTKERMRLKRGKR